MKKVKRETINSFGRHSEKVEALVKELGVKIEEPKGEPKVGEVWCVEFSHTYFLVLGYAHNQHCVCIDSESKANIGKNYCSDINTLYYCVASSPEEYFRKKFNGEL